ncbi:MAG: hypothetical protein ACRD5W_17905, partial [Candidatus Acidiferrales bacterium]
FGPSDARSAYRDSEHKKPLRKNAYSERVLRIAVATRVAVRKWLRGGSYVNLDALRRGKASN